MPGRADTIFAVVTGPARAGVAIVRLSGDRAVAIGERIAGRLPAVREVALRALRAPDGELLDRALVVRFASPRSYTGEDCVELHLHGGRAVCDAVASTLLELGARSAEPGEFTRRAFLSGRLDLIEAEGIADLVAAETDRQRRQALAQAGGQLSDVYRDWSDRLSRLLAYEEARIDFPDETAEDVDVDVAAGPDPGIDALHVEMMRHLADGAAAGRVRDGLRIAFAGAPNVGKSSLINRITDRDVSIVTPLPGTTRDLVEADIVLAGVPCVLVDTAGVRDGVDEIEREGIRRARRATAAADIVVMITSADTSEPPPGSIAPMSNVIDVTNKIDLSPAAASSIGVCARDGRGLPALRAALERQVVALTRHSDGPVMTNARHRDCISEAVRRLDHARKATETEFRAEELRLARRSLGRLTGVAGVEDLLDTIFSSFCIGK